MPALLGLLLLFLVDLFLREVVAIAQQIDDAVLFLQASGDDVVQSAVVEVPHFVDDADGVALPDAVCDALQPFLEVRSPGVASVEDAAFAVSCFGREVAEMLEEGDVGDVMLAECCVQLVLRRVLPDMLIGEAAAVDNAVDAVSPQQREEAAGLNPRRSVHVDAGLLFHRLRAGG